MKHRYFLSGPSTSLNIVSDLPHQKLAEELIVTICRLTNDDESEYTLTLLDETTEKEASEFYHLDHHRV